MTDKPPQPQPNPNGWDRFEKAVDAALHAPPQHKPAKPQAKAESKQSKSKGSGK